LLIIQKERFLRLSPLKGEGLEMSLDLWKTLGSELMDLLRLETYPVAVKLLKVDEKFPSDVRRPLRVLGTKITLCQAFGMTRRYGWTIGISEEECACNVAHILFGWATLENGDYFAEFLTNAGFFKDKNVALRGAKLTLERYVLRPGECSGIITSPLNRTKIDPDVVLVYGNPSHAFILTLGHLYNVGGAVEIQYTGRHASCGHGVIQTLAEKKFNIVLPDEGDKIFAATEDYELIVALPANMLSDVISGVKGIYEKRIVRYPTPFYMRFQPEFPEPFKQLGMKLKQAKGK
jgi:uncharacterized protein (DUF169 family)